MEQAGQAALQERYASTTAAPAPPSPVFTTAQRLIESAVIAVVTSTGLYLVGSVYADAYYGRMSIEVTALDLSPPFIALQSAHVLQSLFEYPSTLLVFYLLYRFLLPRMAWVSDTYDLALRRFGRLFLLIVNLAIVFPLVRAAIEAGDEGVTGAISVLSDVGGLMETLGFILLIYVVWLSFGPRSDIISQIRARKLIPIALLFTLYLLDALVSTAHGAAEDAELLMTGLADASIAITFTMTSGVSEDLPATELIMVTARNGNYVVVERQNFPPSGRPVAYIIPFDAVDVARTQRMNAADLEIDEWEIMGIASPAAP
ncbi:MAG: hypothetical protein ACRDJC_23115 [Thermomicrobiales bacterium]